MEAQKTYKELLTTYLLFQEWKKAVTSALGSSATPRELMYMFDIYEQPGKSIGHYARLNLVTPGTYTATQKSLTRKKLITITKDNKDERIRILNLTEVGKRVVAQNLLYFQKLIDRLQRELGEEVTRNFMQAVKRSAEIMSERLGHYDLRQTK